MSESPASMYSSDRAGSIHETRVPGVATLIQAIPELRAGTWQLSTYRVLEVRKQRRKRIVFARLSYREGQRAAARRVVTKVYGSDRGARALAALRQLWLAGFHAPSAQRVPQPFGYEREAGALYQGHAPGVQWADLLSGDADELERASRRAARWLGRLQRTPIAGATEPPILAAKEVRTGGRELGRAFPAHKKRIAAIAGRIARELVLESVSLAPSHGDYHPKNVFLAARFVTVIDFDTFALRERAHDVGYAIAQLLIMSFFRTGGFAPGVHAARAFQAASARNAEWRRVRLHISRSFLQSLRYELCTLRNGRHALLERWPDVADRALASETVDAFTRELV